jgi:hypothetical protein
MRLRAKSVFNFRHQPTVLRVRLSAMAVNSLDAPHKSISGSTWITSESPASFVSRI